jgi:mono/diheme cytochrome c family protein
VRPVFLVPAFCAVLGAAPVVAQDALAGKRLYLDAARLRGTGVSCVDCHGGLPGGAFGIGRSANDPTAVERAVNSIPQMTPFRGRLQASDYADLAAFIGRPDVPSPLMRTTTSGPAARGAKRLQYEAQVVGSTSAVSRWQLTNDGAVALRLTGPVLLRGEHAADFAAVASDCTAGRTLAAGATCSVELAFRPQSAGARRAAAAVPHDWIGGETALALLGDGTAGPAPPPATTAPLGTGGGGGASGVGLLLALALVSSLRHARAARSRVSCQPPSGGHVESQPVQRPVPVHR